MTNQQMTLRAFRVTNFRSVRDSGWIDAGEITSLIGTNESGKTNILLPLWKLNPAKEGEVKLLTDAPRKDYNSYRQLKQKPDFIHARFQLNTALAKTIADKTGRSLVECETVEVRRNFDAKYSLTFPALKAKPTTPATELDTEVIRTVFDIDSAGITDDDENSLKASILAGLRKASQILKEGIPHVGEDGLRSLLGPLEELLPKKASEQSVVVPRFRQLVTHCQKLATTLTVSDPAESDEVVKLVVKNLPVFVYYTTYGNLDSEIYLPHVIEDLERKDLTGRAEARSRTLRVLFDFVKLKPQEILELGKDWGGKERPTEQQIQDLNEKKKERSVLLQSAGTELTGKFRDWWKQGEYRIRFEADGNHFRIWVSDDQRPEEIELEGRSTGLQWFLSFYLIFLVESRAAHKGAILLLDEPGHTLHPIAQKDLATFFENLASSNQLIYTTHSPFLVDSDHLDRVRAVFVNERGESTVSTNLRASSESAQSKSIYPVHAALGLSVSDTLLQGCTPVIVEGQSDQLYLSIIKNELIRRGRIRPAKELVFVPTSGVKAIRTVAAILGGRDGELPVVLCDGDEAGRVLVKALRDDLYSAEPSKVVAVSDACATRNAEIEDLLPAALLIRTIDRFLKGPSDEPFEPSNPADAILPQAEAYARKHGLVLARGWKVEVARLIKGTFAGGDPAKLLTDNVVETWCQLFERIMGVSLASKAAVDAIGVHAG